MEEKIVITDRRTAHGKTKPVIFFSLQVILLELISFLFFILFDAFHFIGIAFIAIAQVISFSFMIKGYKRVIRRQQQRAHKEQQPVYEIEEETLLHEGQSS